MFVIISKHLACAMAAVAISTAAAAPAAAENIAVGNYGCFEHRLSPCGGGVGTAR